MAHINIAFLAQFLFDLGLSKSALKQTTSSMPIEFKSAMSSLELLADFDYKNLIIRLYLSCIYLIRHC
jgi:hypothetical protein